MLKPMLARGELRMVGATTLDSTGTSKRMLHSNDDFNRS
jgi:ATP-dependent Clp protease ATP-binding subunit ClpA